jgi:hypothetical protein
MNNSALTMESYLWSSIPKETLHSHLQNANNTYKSFTKGLPMQGQEPTTTMESLNEPSRH